MDQNDNAALPCDSVRLNYIKKTIEGRLDGEDIDLGSIVARSMDAYSAEQIDYATSQREFEISTIILGRKVADAIYKPLADFGDLVAVIVPTLVYSLILYPLVYLLTEWDTPLPSATRVLFSGIPFGLALAFTLVSFPKSELKPYPLGVLKDTIGGFIVRIRVKPAVIGLILTGVISWFWLGAFNARKEAKAVSFDSAKNLLVDKSLSTMKDLQVSSDMSHFLSGQQTDITLGPNNVITIKTQESPHKNTVKYVIDDKGAFPGQLAADVTPASSVISWAEEGKPEVVKTQIYVCKVKDLSPNAIVLEAIMYRDASQQVLTPPQNEGIKPSGALIIVKVNGSSIDLTFNPSLIDATALSRGQNILIAFDEKSRVASRIETLSAQSSEHSTSELRFSNALLKSRDVIRP